MADVRGGSEAQIEGFNGTTFDLLRTFAGYDTAAASVPAGLLAVLAPDRRYTSVSLGTVIGNTQAWDTGGAGEVKVYVGTTTTGTFTFEGTVDGTNWVASEVFDDIPDLWVSGQNLTPTSGKVYRVGCRGYRQVRAKTVATLGVTVSLVANVVPETGNVTSIDVGAAPHNMGYVWNTKTAQYTTAQTGAALWTPASGKKLCITSYQIQAGGTTAGTVQLWFGASGDTAYTRGTDSAIFDGEFAPSATLKPGVVQTGVWQSITVDYVLRVTDSAAINPLTVTVWGYEYQ